MFKENVNVQYKHLPKQGTIVQFVFWNTPRLQIWSQIWSQWRL